MLTGTSDQSDHTLAVVKEEEISAPAEVVFEALLEQFGPRFDRPDGSSLPMKLEPWPGGRWYRDLGDNAGHLWGHVQVIKPPTLLEISGPLFMSSPVVSHVQCRIEARGGVTRLTIAHRAIGEISAEHRRGVGPGWDHIVAQVRRVAERRAGATERAAQR